MGGESRPTGSVGSGEAGAYPFVLAGILGGDGELESALSAYEEAARLAPHDPFVRLAYAELLSQLGRIADASEEVAAARQLAPGEPEVFRVQGRIAMSRADRDAGARVVARDAFERLIAIEPDDIESLVALGQLYFGEGQSDRAVTVLDRAAGLRPGQPMIESLRGRAKLASGDLAGASSVQRALLASHPERLELRFDLADTLSSLGNPSEADAILAQAPAEQSSSPELRRRRAVFLLLAGDLEAARGFANGVQAEFPENGSLRVLVASIEQADGQWERVVNTIGSLAARPGAPEAVVAMQVEALERLGRVDAALELLDARSAGFAAAGKRAEALDAATSAAELALRSERAGDAERRARALAELPAADAGGSAARDRNVAWILAEAALSRSDWSAARAALHGLEQPGARAKEYEIAVRAGLESEAATLRAALDSGTTEEQLALAEAESRLERFADAVPLYRRVLAGDASLLRARFGIAMALERSREIEASEREFETILERNPEHAPSLNYLGYMWIDDGRHLDRAVEMVTRAVRSDPSNAAYVDSLGWGLHRQGRAHEAVQALERAARLEPGDATILEHLGDACVAAGDPRRAREVYERALSLSGRGADLEAKIARIARSGGAS